MISAQTRGNPGKKHLALASSACSAVLSWGNWGRTGSWSVLEGSSPARKRLFAPLCGPCNTTQPTDTGHGRLACSDASCFRPRASVSARDVRPLCYVAAARRGACNLRQTVCVSALSPGFDSEPCLHSMWISGYGRVAVQVVVCGDTILSRSGPVQDLA